MATGRRAASRESRGRGDGARSEGLLSPRLREVCRYKQATWMHWGNLRRNRKASGSDQMQNPNKSTGSTGGHDCRGAADVSQVTATGS